jgi:hypothetical protein
VATSRPAATIWATPGWASHRGPEWTASLGASYQHASGFFASALFSSADATYTDPASPVVTALEARRPARSFGIGCEFSW